MQRRPTRTALVLSVLLAGLAFSACFPPPPPAGVNLAFVGGPTNFTVSATTPTPLVGGSLVFQNVGGVASGTVTESLVNVTGFGTFGITPTGVDCDHKTLAPNGTTCAVLVTYQSTGLPGTGTATLRVTDGVVTVDVALAGTIIPD